MTPGLPSRACLAVRFTAKNGDHAEAGKIWENRFYTEKMGRQGPKCTQIDESTCQGVIWACQNFFSFTIHSVAVTFLDVIFHLLHLVLNRQNMDFSPALISYFSAQIFNISQRKELPRSAGVKTTEFSRAFQISVWVTRPERPKGVKDEVKQARRAAT